MNNQPQAQTGLRQYFNIRGARVTLLIMIIMTVVNMVLYLTTEGEYVSYYFFSFSVPYDAVTLFDFYAYEFGMPELLFVGIATAIVCLTVYLLLWIFSAKNRYVLLAAAILLTLDLAELVLLCDILSVIPDILIHIVVLVELYGTYIVEGKAAPEAEAFTVVAEETPAAEEDPFAYAREPVDPQDGNANTSNE